MTKKDLEQLYKAHKHCDTHLNRFEIVVWLKDVLAILVPEHRSEPIKSIKELEARINSCCKRLNGFIKQSTDCEGTQEICTQFCDSLIDIKEKIDKDAEAINMGDPAAKSVDEVRHAYLSFYGISAYRIAHRLHELNVELIPRIISEHAHGKTGIDIHPGAIIGERFFIDHGTGVVIGETAHIGENVKIYQGVTLGALSVDKNSANTKRHPTVGNNVVIYSNATILGGDTVIGDNSIIGGNVWLIESVPAGTKLYYRP